MVIGMKFFMSCKNSAYLLSILLLVACQPPAPADERHTIPKNEAIDTPFVISADSVTMTPEHILNIKPSRYQPSLGLQGNIEPVKQTQLMAARALKVEQVLVKKGQLVEKGAPLLMVRRQIDTSKQLTDTNETILKKSDSVNATTKKSNNTAATDNQAANQNTINSVISKDHSSSEPSKQLPNTAPNDKNNTNANQAAELTTDRNRTSESVNPQSTQSKSNISPRITAADNITDDAANSENLSQLIIIRASFSGRVDTLYAQAGQKFDPREPLLTLSDDTDLHFIATLPLQAKPQLSVGQTVNFTAQGLSETFTGQVSDLVASDRLLVYVHVVENEASRNTLKPDMFVTGRVNYGQIEVGAVVPEHALHDVDLTTLQKPPYQPLTPLAANVWIIKQDQRLARQPIEVINYNPSTGQYLIAGISNDSLICLADLPIESAGKKVVVS